MFIKQVAKRLRDACRPNIRRRRFIGIAVLGLGLAGAVGCGWLGDGSSEAAAGLEAAQAKFRKAQRDYTAPAETGEASPTLSQFRLNTLQAAAKDLQPVLDSQAEPRRKQRARRLLAEVHAAQAHAAAKQASEATVKLSALRSDMRTVMNRLRQAHRRAGGKLPQAGTQAAMAANQAQGPATGEQLLNQLFLTPPTGAEQPQQPAQPTMPAAGSPAEEIQQAIRTLRTGPGQQNIQLPLGLQAQQQRMQQLAQQINQKQQRLEAARQKAGRLQQQAKAKLTQAQKVRSNAFDAQGQQEYDLLQQAAKLTREGNDLSYQADRVEVTINDLERVIGRLQTRQQLAQKAADRLQQRIGAFEKDARQLTQQKQQAAQAQQQAAQALADLVSRLREHYQQQVQQPYAAAADHLDQAVTLMQEAVDQAEPDRRAVYQMALLGHYLDQSHVLSQHASAVRLLVIGLRAKARPAVVGNAAQPLNQTIGTLTQQHQQLVSRLNQTVEAGVQLANNISGVGEQFAQAVQTRQQQLQQYREMVNPNLAAAGSER